MSPVEISQHVAFGQKVKVAREIASIGNFMDGKPGTTFHLHFDVLIPTQNGWQFAPPYATLVNSYERLINGRGTEISSCN